MIFDTKIAVVVRSDLAVWQKLNVTSFLSSGLAHSITGIIGDDYEDASGKKYYPMFKQPVLIFEADANKIRTIYERAANNLVKCAVYTEELFSTGNDVDNRAMVKRFPSQDLNLVGLAMCDNRKTIDKIFKGVSLHK